MKSLPPNVLVTSASKKAPLINLAKQAISKIHPNGKVIAGDIDPAAIAFYVADDYWVMPRTEDEFAKDIIDGCKDRNITIILPTRDAELAFWARHAAILKEASIDVIVSSGIALERCLDKLLFFRFGVECSFPIIPTSSILNEISASRYVVKERFGSGSCGIGLNLDRAASMEYSAKLRAPIYQPFIAGVEISADAWLDRHCKVKGIVLRRRELVVSGESQITTTFRDDNLEREATSLLEKLQIRGPVVLQGIIDDHGAINYIECNPRFGGASTASIAAGLDSLYWAMLEAQGDDLSDIPFLRIAGEVRQVRISADIHINDPCA